MNLFNSGIPLGKWFGIHVLIHWTFVLFAAMRLFNSQDPQGDAVFMLLLFATVLMHEFGHSLACRSVGGQADHIVLWPLGGLAFVNPPPRPWPQLWTTVAGPLVNAVLIPVFWVAIRYLLPRLPPGTLATEYLEVIMVSGLFINIGLLAFNLLPVYPMDGGRILQEVLWLFIGYPRSLLVSGMIGTAGGVGFMVLGLGLATVSIPMPFIGSYPLGRSGIINGPLIAIGLLAAMSSYGIYQHAQRIMGTQRR